MQVLHEKMNQNIIVVISFFENLDLTVYVRLLIKIRDELKLNFVRIIFLREVRLK
jgi:hypothetical protein